MRQHPLAPQHESAASRACRGRGRTCARGGSSPQWRSHEQPACPRRAPPRRSRPASPGCSRSAARRAPRRSRAARRPRSRCRWRPAPLRRMPMSATRGSEPGREDRPQLGRARGAARAPRRRATAAGPPTTGHISAGLVSDCSKILGKGSTDGLGDRGVEKAGRGARRRGGRRGRSCARRRAGRSRRRRVVGLALRTQARKRGAAAAARRRRDRGGAPRGAKAARQRPAQRRAGRRERRRRREAERPPVRAVASSPSIRASAPCSARRAASHSARLAARPARRRGGGSPQSSSSALAQRSFGAGGWRDRRRGLGLPIAAKPTARSPPKIESMPVRWTHAVSRPRDQDRRRLLLVLRPLPDHPVALGLLPRRARARQRRHSAPYLLALASALLFFGSILLHELGHAFVAMRTGSGSPRSRCGCSAASPAWSATPTRPGTEFKIAIAGPVVTLAIAVVCAGDRDRCSPGPTSSARRR